VSTGASGGEGFSASPLHFWAAFLSDLGVERGVPLQKARYGAALACGARGALQTEVRDMCIFHNWFIILYGESYTYTNLTEILDKVQKDMGRDGEIIKAIREGRISIEDVNPKILDRARTLMHKYIQGDDQNHEQS
jgi:hypothetical protein